MEVNCKYPRIIRNPQFNNLVLSGYRLLKIGNYQQRILTRDVENLIEDGYLRLECLKIILGYKLKDEFTPSPTLPQYINNYQTLSKEEKHLYTPIYSINPEELDNYIIVNEDTGDFERIFMLTTCGHCVLCDTSKSRKLQYRCILESSVHPNPPMFLTLTYDSEHYPVDDKDLKAITRELQLFNKRLRKYLWKSGQPTDFKYCVVSEYGSKRKRLHFHGLYFGLHNSNYVQIKNEHADKQVFPYIYRFNDIVRKCWKKGFVRVEVSRDPSGKYVSKYMGKQNSKCLKSKFFGKEAIMRKLDEIRANPRESTFSILNPLNNKAYDIPICNFVANIAYPSIARQIPVDYRRKLQLFVQYGLELHLSEYFKMKYPYLYTDVGFAMRKLWPVIKLCGFDNIDVTVDIYDYEWNYENFMELYCELRRFPFDIEQVEYLKGLHDEHVLFSNISNFDTQITAYKAIRNHADLLRLEKDDQ